MKKAWSADLPLVTVPQAPQPKSLTIVMPYYENPQFLRKQIDHWFSFPAWKTLFLSAIITDDGSPTSPAAEAFPSVLPFPIRLFRIRIDVRWNWLAARNIGMYHAPDGWCLLTDMDHVLPEATAQAIVNGAHDPGVIYGFSRAEHTGEPLSPHPNSWLMTRGMFWKVGGYDERLSGHYGTDGPWRRRMARTAPIHILTDRLIRHEHQGDSSTKRYLRKQPVDANVSRLLATFGNSAPRVLSFPYHEEPLGRAVCR